MALTSLTAKANVGAGTDILGGETIDSKFFGGVRTVSDAGAGHRSRLRQRLPRWPGISRTRMTLLHRVTRGFCFSLCGRWPTPSAGTDGDYAVFNLDAEGRLKVATKPASFDLVSSDITASAQTAFCDVSRASNVMISMVTVSLAGHNVTFEGSLDSTNGTDGNWFGIQVVRSQCQHHRNHVRRSCRHARLCVGGLSQWPDVCSCPRHGAHVRHGNMEIPAWQLCHGANPGGTSLGNADRQHCSGEQPYRLCSFFRPMVR